MGEARPDETLASEIASGFSGRSVRWLRRFPTGIGHWVYDVQDSAGDNFVVRIGSPDQAEDFVGAAHWSQALRPIGVPLPSLLATGKHNDFPYAVLERLPGEDLGVVYDGLELGQKRTIAARMFAIQRLVATLGEGRAFGYVKLPGAPGRSSWRQVIDDSIRRSQSRMASANSLNSRAIERVSTAVERMDGYFARVRPIPFLDDTTTKNVLVHDGSFSGIVDVDWICFGDPLLTVALTRASLLNSGRDLAYTDYWCELFEPSRERDAALRFYTALFCLDFMSEFGHRFSRDTPTVSAREVERLDALLHEQLSGI